jgi:hypothetical protein
MDGLAEQPRGDDSAAAEIARAVPIKSVGLSRREFTRRFGGGSAAVVGLAWAAPKITTIRYAAKAKAGSPPPTTTTTLPVGALGHISLSSRNPCVGDTIRVTADGFAPRTAVTLQMDSPAHVLGVTTADSTGKIDVRVNLYQQGPTGTHTLRAIGVQTGGRTLTLSTPITVKTEAECRVGPEGSTTTTAPSTPGTTTTTPTSTTPTSTTSTSTTTRSTPPVTNPGGVPVGGKPLGEGSLAFEAADAVDLALIGAAAAIGGRMLYGLSRPDDDADEE